MLAKAVLRYSPKLLGSKSSANWWLVAEHGELPDIGAYYRHLYHMSTSYTKKLIRPAWQEHVSVVRNEKPPNKEHWEAYAGETVDIDYSLEVKTDGTYYWLPVRSLELERIRVELGLSPEPCYPFHLTFANEKNQ